jgi:hypothetical protein
VGVVEFLNKGQGFSLVLGGEHGSELSREGQVVRGLLKGGTKEGFSLWILLFGDE